jgi:hypothetical protein
MLRSWPSERTSVCRAASGPFRAELTTSMLNETASATIPTTSLQAVRR